MDFSLKKLLPLLVYIIYSAINVSYAQGQGNIVYANVPFQNVSLNPGDTLQANFSFGIQSQIFCYDNFFQNVGVVTWTYQGKSSSSNLAIFLTTKPGFYQGFGIDANGAFTIFNNQPSGSTPLVLNCQFSI